MGPQQRTSEAPSPFHGVSAFPLTPFFAGGVSSPDAEPGPALEAGTDGREPGAGGREPGAGGRELGDSGSGPRDAPGLAPGPASGRIDEVAFAALVARAATAGVASIAVLGSTGSYMYLSAAERERVVQIAVEYAAGVPVLVGVGAISTQEVLEHVRAAEAAGAAGLIVAPVSYQRLSDREALRLFQEVGEAATVPIVVYDNPGTTGFTFSLELYAEIAALPGIASIKVPPPPSGLAAARACVDSIRAVVPAHVTIGVSGDASAALGLSAGCDAWYSVIAGALPEAALALAREASGVRGSGSGSASVSDESRSETADAVTPGSQESDSQGLVVADAVGPVGSVLAPLLDLFGEFGSLRVVAAATEELGLVRPDSLPRPVLGLEPAPLERVHNALGVLNRVRALAAEEPRVRLEAAMAAGSQPVPTFVRPLIERMGGEPDFQVREMLTWALVRHHECEGTVVSGDPAFRVLPHLLDALTSQSPLARAQSLHTLTKINSPDIWGCITTELLHDRDDEVARTAWRAAAQLWPVEERSRLADELVRELGRGDLDVMRSLARAFVQLGELGGPALNAALASREARVRAHAEATVRLCDDPESTFWMERA